MGHTSGASLCWLEYLWGTAHLFDRRVETGRNIAQRRRRCLRCLCGPAQIRSAGSERRYRFPRHATELIDPTGHCLGRPR